MKDYNDNEMKSDGMLRMFESIIRLKHFIKNASKIHWKSGLICSSNTVLYCGRYQSLKALILSALQLERYSFHIKTAY